MSNAPNFVIENFNCCELSRLPEERKDRDDEIDELGDASAVLAEVCGVACSDFLFGMTGDLIVMAEKPNVPAPNGTEPVCYSCGGRGHFANQCPSNMNGASFARFAPYGPPRRFGFNQGFPAQAPAPSPAANGIPSSEVQAMINKALEEERLKNSLENANRRIAQLEREIEDMRMAARMQNDEEEDVKGSRLLNQFIMKILSLINSYSSEDAQRREEESSGERLTPE